MTASFDALKAVRRWSSLITDTMLLMAVFSILPSLSCLLWPIGSCITQSDTAPANAASTLLLKLLVMLTKAVGSSTASASFNMLFRSTIMVLASSSLLTPAAMIARSAMPSTIDCMPATALNSTSLTALSAMILACAIAALLPTLDSVPRKLGAAAGEISYSAPL